MQEKKNNTNMKNYSFDDVLRLDQYLHKLALYEVTGGMMIISKGPEEQFELELKIAKTFNYFKKMIQSGECTYEFIKTRVLEKNGPFFQNFSKVDDPNNIKDWDAESQELSSPIKSANQETLQFIKMLMDKADIEDIKIRVEPLPEEKQQRNAKKKKKK